MARSLAPIAIALLAAPACGQLLFSDNFDAGASPLWVNERGPWTTSGGVYYCTAPSNSPPTISSLPYVLGDFELEVDVVGVVDGGIWLHIDSQAQNGALLVTGGMLQTGTGLYWHTVSNGSYSPFTNQTGPFLSSRASPEVRASRRAGLSCPGAWP